MKKYLFLILTFLCAATLTATAQGNGQYVTWKYSSKTLPNGSVELFFDAVVPDGFRLYSPYNPEGASKPLKITLEQSANFTTDGKVIELAKPEEHYEEVFEVTEKFFKKTAKFKIVIKPTTDKPFDVTGSLDGQVCNDEWFCAMVMDNFKIGVTPSKSKDNKADKKDEKPADTKKNAEPKQEVAPQPPKTDSDATKTDTVADAKSDTTSINSDNSSTKTDTAKHAVVTPTQNGGDSPTPSAETATTTDGNGESMWWVFAIAFLAGLAAIFTPCVFPMIPMTVTFFLKDKSGKGKMNALIYGLSIVLLYTLPVAILIIISNMIGGATFTAGIFNALSTHWLPNIIFFVIFMVFALSFLGMFEIVLPSGIINRAEQRGDKGGLIGVFFMAFVLVLVSFSCTGPIVGSVLVESASGGSSYAKPIVAILGFSIAFAMPFTLFAFFPEILKKLPKSGGWLNTVKVVLGFVELALGLKFLSVADQTYHWHILDRETYLAIWIAIGFLLTAYLLGKLKLPHDSDLPHIKVPRLLLAIVTLSFTVYMIPGLWGAPLKALAGYIPPITTQDFVINNNETSAAPQSPTTSNLCKKPLYSDFLKLPHGIQAYFEYDEAADCAKKQNKPLLLVFTGHGCVNCRKMEENVWTDPRVSQKMQNDFVLCALYTDDRTLSSDGTHTIGQVNTEIQISRYNINAQPYYVIVDPATGASIKPPMSYNPDVESVLQWLGN